MNDFDLQVAHDHRGERIGQIQEQLEARDERIAELEAEVERAWAAGKASEDDAIEHENRALRAEAKLRAVEGLLKAASCPDCDGSGSYGRETPNGGCEQVQCQFCYEREAALKEGEQP